MELKIYKINSSYIIVSSRRCDDIICEKFPDNDYEIKHFNMQNLTTSLKYNPLQYLTSDESVFSLVKTILDKTHGWSANGHNPYDVNHQAAEQELLTFILLYLSKEKKNKTFFDVLDLLETYYHDEKYDGLDTIFMEFKEKHPNDITNHYFSSFKKKPIDLQKWAIISCSVRLTLFVMQDIKQLTDYDELKLEELDTKKQILIITLHPSDSSLDFLVELLLSQIDQIYGIYKNIEKASENRLQYLNRFVTLCQMEADSTYYLKKMIVKDSKNRKIYKKDKEEIIKFKNMFKKRMEKKFDASDDLELTSYEEYRREYFRLLKLARCSTRALDLLDISSETYSKKMDEYWQVYREYSNELEEKMYQLFGTRS